MLKGPSFKRILLYFRAFFIIIVVFLCLNLMFSCDFRAKRYKDWILGFAEKYALEASEVFAVTDVESGFYPNVRSKAGAIGLMQIMPSTGKWIADELGILYSDDLLFDPKTNIEMGCFYLSYLYTKFNDPKYVYAAYNAGETVVAKWIADGLEVECFPYPETKAYVQKVLKRKKYYESKKFAVNH